MCFNFFFFSSRRRHTRCSRDWSSDVCSSDLDALALAQFCLTQRADVIPAGSGFLPENWLLEAAPGGVLARLVRGRRTQPWLPCEPQGLSELREQIASRLVQNGIAAGPANIVTTYGASQALDLLARI